MPEEDKIANVPFFIHEAVCDKLERSSKAALDVSYNAVEKANESNKRMLVALVAVCLTLLMTVAAFLVAYRDMNNRWISFYEINSEEVQNGELVQGTSEDNQGTLEG